MDGDVVPNEDLTAEDQVALGWAISVQHAPATSIAERIRSGGSGVTRGELAAIRDDWDQAGRPVPERHVHRSAVTFVDGSVVHGVTFLAGDPYGREVTPAYGLYLDERWAPPWPHDHVDWPDFGLPRDPEAFVAALRELLDRARGGSRVEIGCLGGHGRTGTALACLAVLAGTPASEAVAWVRTNYCPKAVETAEQEVFAAGFTPDAS